jgi:putative inorganic carbon (HCO3(-)) transporter
LSTTDHSALGATRSAGADLFPARRSPQSIGTSHARPLRGIDSVRSANIEILMQQVVFLVLLTRAACDPVFELWGFDLAGSRIGFGAAVNALIVAIASAFAVQKLSVAKTIFPIWAPYLGLAFLATIYASNPTTAGRQFVVMLTYAAMFALPFFMFRSPADLRRFILLILASSVIPSVVAIFELRTALTDADDFRLQSTFSHPNIFAFYLVLLIGLALYIRTSKAIDWSPYIRTIVTVYIPVLLVFLAMTKTRSAWAAGAMILLVYAVWLERRLLLVGILVAPILLLGHSVISNRLADLSADDEIESFSELNAEVRLNSLAWRQALWESALPSIAAKPILGHGLESFRPATPYFFPLVGPQGIDAHNLYLQTAFEMGAIGALALVWMIAAIARCLWHGRRYDPRGMVIVFGIFAAYLIESYSDNVIYYLAFNWYFMFAIGTICAWIVYRKERDATNRSTAGTNGSAHFATGILEHRNTG